MFLRFMAENAVKVVPPLGLIRDFSFDNNPAFPHTLDLKAFGARLFVDAARIIALAHGIPHSSTVERLRAAAAHGNLGGDDINAMIEGFFFIQQLRLRNQRAGTPPGGENRVDPDKLNELDRQVLKEAFKQAKRLQSRLQLEYRCVPRFFVASDGCALPSSACPAAARRRCSRPSPARRRRAAN
jgi:CBS domain-containing protein